MKLAISQYFLFNYLLWRTRLVHISSNAGFKDEAAISFRHKFLPPKIVHGQLRCVDRTEKVDLDDSQIWFHRGKGRV